MTGKSKVAEKRRHFWTNSTIGVCHFNTETRFHANRLHELARANGVETHKLVEKILPGWEGKSKGLLQMLWERGLLDPQLLDNTLWKGKNPISGKSDLQYLLRNIIAKCSDFKNEETALQYLGSQLGVQVLFNSKIPRRTSRGRHRIQLGSCEVILSTCSCISKEGTREFQTTC